MSREGNGDILLVPRILPQDARLVRRAIAGGWVSDAQGLYVAQCMEDVLRDPESSTRNKVAAARTLAALAGVDARREATASREHTSDTTLATQALRAALASQDGAKALAALSAQLLDSSQTAQPTTATLPPAS